MIILNIETSTSVCSVSVSENGKSVFSVLNDEGQNHAALLSLYVQSALEFISIEKKRIDSVAVSSGPGSYTGLRIGVSTAKGLCYGFEVPLISISTLKIMALTAISTIKDSTDSVLYCPMIDARRMEVYSAFYDGKGNLVREIAADIIDSSSYAEVLQSHIVYFFGNGAGKLKETLLHPNVRFVDDIVPTAEGMIGIAEKKYANRSFEDVAYFEPFYLKEFQTTVPKKNL